MGPEEKDKDSLTDRISGAGQEIIGEIEIIGGILTGDPVTQAEGEFNVEVGDIRDDLEEEIDGEAADQ
ncbi:MAG TPA: hypothetical protein VL501_04070 [Pyrinomonadaceae bacterium]|nr:hypothetical protein [Pyrinomonadaceae bacterium]